MAKIRIFKIECTRAYMMSELGTGLSLYPWGKNTESYEGDDDGGTVYELPEGYTVSVTGAGDLGIFDPHDCYCHLWQRGQKIALTSDCSHISNGKLVYLAESDDQDFENDVYE